MKNTDIRTFFKLSTIPILVFIFLVTIPTFLLKNDIWDGVLIEYAAEIKDFSGLKNWFYESTWYLQYPFVLSVIKLSNLLAVSYKNFNSIITLAILILMLYEAYKFCKIYLQLGDVIIVFVLLSIVTFPPWTALLSSVLTFHFSCIYAGMVGLRYAHRKELFSKIIGLIFIVYGFSLQSQFVFLPFFSYIYDVVINKENKNIALPSFNTLLIFVLSIVTYTFLNIFYPTSGIFSNYQGLIIFHLNGIFPFLLRGIGFSTYLIPITVSTFIYIIYLLNTRTINNVSTKKETFFVKNSILIWVLLLFISGAFPYMAVGKDSVYWGVNDWVGRQAFLLCIPVSILAGLLVNVSFRYILIPLKKSVLIFGLFLISANSVLLIYGNLAKFNRQHFFSSIEEVVRLNKENLAPGLIQIIVNQSPQTVFEFYEPNYLMYKATGKASWFTKINNTIDDNFLLPCFFKNKDIYYQQFIYNKNNSNNLTQTAIILDVKGFIGFTAMINNTFNLKGKGTVNLVSINKLKNINLSNCTL